MRYGLPNACSLLCAVGFAVALSLQASPASAQAAGSEAGAAASSSSAHKAAFRHHGAERNRPWSAADEPYIGHGAPQWRYFVELRARNAASYGHMYVMYGEVNNRHEIVKSEIAGFFPAGDARDCLNCSVYYWTIGHVLPVPSEIGASDGDLEEQYVLARFRVWIDADQYKRLIAYINERKAHKGLWHAFFANCVTFGRDVASFLNVKMPPLVAFAPSLAMYPKDLVETIWEANGVMHEQAPLKDAPGTLPVEVATEGQHRQRTAEKTTSTPPSIEKRLSNQRAEGHHASSEVH